MENKQENEREWSENGVCMIKWRITKASQQAWSNSVARLLLIVTPSIEFKGTMLACIHPVPKTLP